MKYNQYFDNFICQFKTFDELRVSLVFSDEFVNVKIKDPKNLIPDKINYFKLIDKYYSLKSNDNMTIDIKKLKEEFNKSYRQRSIKSYIKENANQLIELDKNLIKIFLLLKKSRNLYESLKIKEKEEIKIDSIEKISIITTIETFFYSILNREYFVRCSYIYIFSIIFPLFPYQKLDLFFKELLLNNINKITFFQRYYIYIILKSIHKYYLVNQKKGYFPELTLENIKKYCTLIKDYLIDNSIIPNEEIFVFLKKILCGDNLVIKENEKKEKKDNNFVFVLDEVEKNENIVLDGIVKKEVENELIYNYKGETKECHLLDGPILFQITYSIYDNYFNDLKFDILNFEFESIKNIIINLFYYLLLFKENNLAKFLIEAITIMKKLEEDKKLYKSNNNINNQNNIINEEEKDNENKKDDDNENNKVGGNKEDIKKENNEDIKMENNN